MSKLAEKLMASSSPDDKVIAYQVRCLQSWMDRVRVAAERWGVKPAQYIRTVVSQRMDEDGIPKPPPKKPKS